MLTREYIEIQGRKNRNYEHFRCADLRDQSSVCSDRKRRDHGNEYRRDDRGYNEAPKHPEFKKTNPNPNCITVMVGLTRRYSVARSHRATSTLLVTFFHRFGDRPKEQSHSAD